MDLAWARWRSRAMRIQVSFDIGRLIVADRTLLGMIPLWTCLLPLIPCSWPLGYPYKCALRFPLEVHAMIPYSLACLSSPLLQVVVARSPGWRSPWTAVPAGACAP